MPVTEKEVLDALSKIQDPDFQKDIVTLGFVREVRVQDSRVGFELILPTPVFPSKESLRDEAAKAVKTLPGIASVDVQMKFEITGQPATDKPSLARVKNIVAIGSGKGGVGKSTVSVNLAVGLARYGAQVGLIDGDIYGPTIPIMMGARQVEPPQKDGHIVPAESHGIKFMSMGFLAHGDQPLIWRGPMAHRAFQELLLNIDWGPLDYLIIDLPPGTGDVHLTMAQTVSAAGAVIISTPQDVGLTISMKTLRMFEQTKVPILGIIENMSYYVCPHCHQRDDIFGHGMVSQESRRLKIPFLGEIPLDKRIREFADQGVPIVIADPASPSAQAYLQIAERLAAQISIRNHYHRPLQIIEEPEAGPQRFSV